MHPKQVVVAYDFSEAADVALDRAVELACRAPQHVLHFVAAIDPTYGFGLEHDEEVDYRYAEAVQSRLLERLGAIFAARAPEQPIEFFVHARIGDPVEEILDLAQEIGADLIVIGAHGRTGIRRLLLGSTTEAVVRSARCPVVVARAKEYADVTLSRVVRIERDGAPPRPHPRRYSYTSAALAVRPDAWPLH
jgi:nucleotide-binding universal stress UspA family protein